MENQKKIISLKKNSLKILIFKEKKISLTIINFSEKIIYWKFLFFKEKKNVYLKIIKFFLFSK
jgi:hypothetical protein